MFPRKYWVFLRSVVGYAIDRSPSDPPWIVEPHFDPDRSDQVHFAVRCLVCPPKKINYDKFLFIILDNYVSFMNIYSVFNIIMSVKRVEMQIYEFKKPPFLCNNPETSATVFKE